MYEVPMTPKFSGTRQGSRALTPEENERVRTALNRLWKEAGTQRELGRRLGLTPQAISRVVSGEGQGAGVVLARKVAEAMGISVEALLRGESEVADGVVLEPKLGNITGWDAAEAEARRRFKYVPEAAWDAVRNLRTAKPPRHVTAEWIGAIASDWARALAGEGVDESDDD